MEPFIGPPRSIPGPWHPCRATAACLIQQGAAADPPVSCMGPRQRQMARSRSLAICPYSGGFNSGQPPPTRLPNTTALLTSIWRIFQCQVHPIRLQATLFLSSLRPPPEYFCPFQSTGSCRTETIPSCDLLSPAYYPHIHHHHHHPSSNNVAMVCACTRLARGPPTL